MTLRQIEQVAGQGPARAILAVAIGELVSFFNVGMQMDSAQLLQTARLLAAEFPWLKMEDYRLCFDRAMAKGRVYDRLDGNVVIGWVREYARERDAAERRLKAAEELHRSDSLRSLNRWAIGTLNDRDALNDVWRRTGMLDPLKALHLYTTFRRSRALLREPPSLDEFCEVLDACPDKSFRQRRFPLFSVWLTPGSHYFVQNLGDCEPPKGVDLIVPLPADSGYVWQPSPDGGSWTKAVHQASPDF